MNKMTKGGVSAMERTEPTIAEEFMIGNTKVMIATDCCCRPEEVPKILERIARNAMESFRAQASIAIQNESKGQTCNGQVSV